MHFAGQKKKSIGLTQAVFVPEYISLFVEKMANLMAMVVWLNVRISEQNVKECVLVERDK